MKRERFDLVPRGLGQGYGAEAVDQRRQWIEEKRGVVAEQVGGAQVDTEQWRGNVENLIGSVQVPLGLAGPLKVRGEHVDETLYVPMATTEGSLVRSYERGMLALSKAGGVDVRVVGRGNRASSTLVFPGVSQAAAFAEAVGESFSDLEDVVSATTAHGRLVAVIPRVLGRKVLLELRLDTADAQGMNMINRAADAVCRHLAAGIGGEHGLEHWLVYSGHGGEKRQAGSFFAGGKGRRVVASARLDERLMRAVFRATPGDFAALSRWTTSAQIAGGTLGAHGHISNGLAAVYIATGQDVANVVDSSLGLTELEVADDGSLIAQLTLFSLSVGTVGGGTGQGTAAECLDLIGCRGTGHAERFAEIIAATLLAGELSFGGAIASGELAAAHESYGRNRPEQ